MQRLIYQNLRGERVIFALEPYVLASVRGLGMCGVDETTSRGSMQQGQTFTALRRDARTVDATISILARSRAELYALREALCGALSIDKAMDGEKRARLIYENDHGSWWTWAVPEGDVDWKGRACDAHVNIKLSFACESAFLYGIAPNAVTFQRRRSGFRLPMRMPLTLGSNRFSQTAQNRGHAYAPVTITILSDGEIPCLVNRSTGARLALVRQLPVGDRLTVCTDPTRLEARLIHADGTEESGYGLLDPGTSVAGFQLRPGENLLVYEPNADSARSVIRVEWYDSYEGV